MKYVVSALPGVLYLIGGWMVFAPSGTFMDDVQEALARLLGALMIFGG